MSYIKIIFSILGILAFIVAYIPYLRDIFLGKTKPHLYSWLIWAITQGTAVFAILKGNGSFGAYGLAVGEIFILLIFFLCFKYGTKDITKSDTVALLASFVAILFWWQLDNPVLAVILVALIDVWAYIPTFRKFLQDSSTETFSSWVLFFIGDILSILALSSYNFLTLFYLIVIASCNALLLYFFLKKSSKLSFKIW